VWDGFAGDEASDVFFCDYDRVLGTCPVQRITAHLAFQGSSDVDSDQVVWQDDRSGPSEIWGLRLPGLEKLHDYRTREGKLLRIAVRSTTHSGGPEVSLDAEAVGHPSLESIGARFDVLPDGRGWLSWRPWADQAGAYAFTFSATTEAGLVARQTIRVDVAEGFRHRPGASWTSRSGWGRIAHRRPGSICVEIPLDLVHHLFGEVCRP
jgi:hypothetical protein